MGREYHDDGWLDTLADAEIAEAERFEGEPERDFPTPDEYREQMPAWERAKLRRERDEDEPAERG